MGSPLEPASDLSLSRPYAGVLRLIGKTRDQTIVEPRLSGRLSAKACPPAAGAEAAAASKDRSQASVPPSAKGKMQFGGAAALTPVEVTIDRRLSDQS